METALSNHAHIYGDIETEAHMHDVIQSQCLSESEKQCMSATCFQTHQAQMKLPQMMAWNENAKVFFFLFSGEASYSHLRKIRNDEAP